MADDDQFLNDLLNRISSSLNGSASMSDYLQKSSDSDFDCDALINDSDNETQSTSVNGSKETGSSHTQQLNFADLRLDFKVQSVINSQILEQLQQIGKRLDKIENGDCKKTSDKTIIKGTKSLPKTKKVVSTKLKEQRHLITNFLLLILPRKILLFNQNLSNVAGTQLFSKNRYGSQRVGNIEVMVRKRAKWPHEYILSGLTNNASHTTNCQLHSGWLVLVEP